MLEPSAQWVDVAALPPVAESDDKVFLLVDNQVHIGDGRQTIYSDIAYHVTSPEMLSQAGNVQMEWQPDTQDVIVHAVDIIRGTETIDALGDGSGFDVIRREANFEKLSIDGALTATMQLSGLRLNDVIRARFSLVNDDPALAGNSSGLQAVPRAPVEIGRYRPRLIWPESIDLHWTASDEIKPVESAENGLREISFEGLLPKARDQPDRAPSRFNLPPFVNYTTFADWESVSSTVNMLYEQRASFAPDGLLATEVAAIAKTHQGQMARMNAAVELVQSKIRYLYKGMEFGNYTPQTPDMTWQQRYGDCKAKTLLLLTILRELGIESQPMLVSLQNGDAIPQLLPGMYAFDHIIVRAQLDGTDYWLDGTGQGTNSSNIADVAAFHVGLPVTADGSGLVDAPVRPLSQPGISRQRNIDLSAGIGLPALVDTEITVTGNLAALLKSSRAQLDEKSFNDQLDQIIASAGNEAIPISRAIHFEEDDRVAIVSGRAIESYYWQWQNRRFQTNMNPPVERFDFDIDRSRAIWREIPVTTSHPEYERSQMAIDLPRESAPFELKGPASFDGTIAGTQLTHDYDLDGNRLNISTSSRTLIDEISADLLPSIRTEIARAKAIPVRLLAPATIESTQIEARLGDDEGRTKALREAYAQAVLQADADDLDPLRWRANFLGSIGDHAGAAEDLAKVLAAEPSADGYIWLSIWNEEHASEAALEAIAKARELEPASQTAMYQMGKVLWLHNRPEEMLDAIDEFASLGIEEKHVNIVRANALAQSGRGDEALAVLDSAFEAKPGDADLYRARCELKADYGIALEGALKDCTRAAELSEDSAVPLRNRGMIYWRMGRRDDAIEDWNSALLTNPEEQHARYFLGGAQGSKNGKQQQDLAIMADPELPLEIKIWKLDGLS